MTDTRPSLNEQVRDFSREHAQTLIRKQAEDLQRLAQKFEQAADDLDRVPAPGVATHLWPVQQLLHEHAVWLMNARLDSIVQHAAEADIAAALLAAEAKTTGGRGPR